MNIKASISFTLITLLASFYSNAQNLTSAQIDNIVNKDLKLFKVPGIAVGIIKDNKLIYAKGFGVRSLKTNLPVDRYTLFGIASNSKAFTAAALGILVDDGKINWDDKVIKYLPEFKLYDDLATREITIRDLLCHRSGLATGAGDLMHDPDSTNFSVADIIYNLRYIKPAYSFRSRFAYDNNLYLVAGEVIARVANMPWEAFVEQRLLSPLGMAYSRPSYNESKNNPNIIDAHKVIDGIVRPVTRYTSEKDDAAGGIYSNVADLSKWLIMLMNNGNYAGKQILSKQTVEEIFTPQTIIPVHGGGIYNTHFGAYGLGWFITDVKGYKQIFHTGEDVGMVSEVVMIPEMGLGIIVLTNNESNAIDAVTYQILDSYLNVKNVDEAQLSYSRLQKNLKEADQLNAVTLKHLDGEKNIAVNYSLFTGKYHDVWFGDVFITRKKEGLWFSSIRSPQLRGYLKTYDHNTFYIKWQNPEIDSDCLVTFEQAKNGVMKAITIKAVGSTGRDNFSDLIFLRVE